MGSAQDRGHLLELGVGTVVGSLFYALVVNNSGGFLRKPSTLLAHLTAESARQRRRRVRSLALIDLFKGIPSAELRTLAERIQVRPYGKRHTLFRSEDPGESL